jgi:hypothetical protein
MHRVLQCKERSVNLGPLVKSDADLQIFVNTLRNGKLKDRNRVLAVLADRRGISRRSINRFLREGWTVDQKAVRRIDRELGLKVAQPRGNPTPRRAHGQDHKACHLRPSRGKDDVWTWDFIFDRTSDGRSLKCLCIVDECTRECLA